MRALLFSLRSLGRDLRSGEVLVFIIAIAFAVGALTSVGFLTDRIGKAVSLQANEILAADLRLRSQEPIPDTLKDLANDFNLMTAKIMWFPSVIYNEEKSALSTIRAVSDLYPLRGSLRVSDVLFGEQRKIDEIPLKGEIWAEASLLARIDAEVGDFLSIGELKLKISSVLTYRPDQSIGFSSFAPSVLINVKDIPNSNLIGEGSRVSHALLVAGQENEVNDFKAAIQNNLPESVRIQSQEDRTDRVYSATEKAKRFLSLTAVISLLLSAVAVTMSVRRFTSKRMGAIALMKSLGATQGFVITVALIQLFLFTLFGILIGSLIGFAAEELISKILLDLLQQTKLPSAGIMPVILAALSAKVLVIGFALPSLIQLRNTPPLKVLQHEITAPAPSKILIIGLSFLSIGTLLYRSFDDFSMLLVVISGIGIVAILLYLVGRSMAVLFGKAFKGVGVAWRYGFANVSRRGRDSAIQIVAFGIGITVILILTLVRTNLLESWRQTMTNEAPNHFLINIQPHEIESLSMIFEANNIAVPSFTPMVRARMTKINSQSVKERDYPNEDGEWFVNREANLTWANELSSSNKIVDGKWWPSDYEGPPLISIEEEAAKNTGLAIGDRISFFIAGNEIEAEISSIRKVNWDSFQPNFFITLSPFALDNMPTTFVSSMHIEDTGQSLFPELLKLHPSISIIDLGVIIEQVEDIIKNASSAVQVIFLFTIGAGIAVLFAAVQSTIDERRFESAMLRALGARRSTIFIGVITEFVALGSAAGILASAGASLIAYVIATQLFNLPFSFDLKIWLVGTLCGITIVCLSGCLAARTAINAKPADFLREAAN